MQRKEQPAPFSAFVSRVLQTGRQQYESKKKTIMVWGERRNLLRAGGSWYRPPGAICDACPTRPVVADISNAEKLYVPP
jgi:hypothetical protein